jgi:HAD superfamily hydrolase (TIGR01490 family)
VADRSAALFDMDRTLVRIDSATLFIRHQHRKGHAKWSDVARVAFWMMQYTLGVIDVERVAGHVLESFKGRHESWLLEQCEELFLHSVLGHVAQKGRAAVERHRTQGDFVAIITGATPYSARPLARELGIEHVVATELEVAAGLFTGKIKPPMSYGSGKVVLAERLAAVHGFSLAASTFYSDSITDLPLLERVGKPVAINPDARLRRIAQSRGWPIESW